MHLHQPYQVRSASNIFRVARLHSNTLCGALAHAVWLVSALHHGTWHLESCTCVSYLVVVHHWQHVVGQLACRHLVLPVHVPCASLHRIHKGCALDYQPHEHSQYAWNLQR